MCQKKNLWSARPLPPCFPTPIKVNTIDQNECVCVCPVTLLVFVENSVPSLPSCFRFHRARPSGYSSHHRHVNHFHHGHRHRSHHYVLHPEGQARRPQWDAKQESAAERLTFHDDTDMFVCLCSLLLGKSCEGGWSSGQQTGGQKRRSWWDCRQCTHTHLGAKRTGTYW